VRQPPRAAGDLPCNTHDDALATAPVGIVCAATQSSSSETCILAATLHQPVGAALHSSTIAPSALPSTEYASCKVHKSGIKAAHYMMH
jgi:hypothetical protein